MMGCSGCNDTGGASYNCHYVNHSVRGFVRQAPAGFRRPVLDPLDYGCAASSAPGSSLQPSNPRPSRRIPSPP